ncbi:MAG: endonuclease NucS [Thermoproteota archaeon]
MKSSKTTLLTPEMGEAKKTLDFALRTHKCLLIVGRCAVKYQGRAKSQLTAGDRIVIVKEDGSLLVHRSTGYDPVNWMPGGQVVYHTRIIRGEGAERVNKLLHRKDEKSSGGSFQSESEGGILEVHAVRRRPRESVKVFFDRIFMVSALELEDTGEFSLYASEQDMQKAILVEPDLVEEGFHPTSYEKKVNPGFVDVYGTDKEGNFLVVEIKRKTAGIQAVLQLARYVEAIEERVNRKVRGVLVAPNIAKGVQTLLATLNLEFKALRPKECAEILNKSKNRKLESFFG